MNLRLGEIVYLLAFAIVMAGILWVMTKGIV